MEKGEGLTEAWKEARGGHGKAFVVSDPAGLNIGDISIALDQPQTQIKRPMVRNPEQCMPKVALISTMQFRSSNMRERIQYM